MKIKFRCRCGHKIRLPAGRIGALVNCSRCGESQVVPAPGDPAVREVECDCGAIWGPGEVRCPQCRHAAVAQLPPVGEDEQAVPVTFAALGASAPATREAAREAPPDPPARRDVKDPSSAAGQPPAGHGPVELPPGQVLDAGVVVKYHCACGKKVRLEIGQYGRAGQCPRCEATLTFPDVTRDRKFWLQCPCGAAWVPGCATCAACGRAFFRPASHVPAGTLPVPAPFVPGSAAAAPPAPEAPVPAPPNPASTGPGPDPSAGPRGDGRGLGRGVVGFAVACALLLAAGVTTTWVRRHATSPVVAGSRNEGAVPDEPRAAPAPRAEGPTDATPGSRTPAPVADPPAAPAGHSKPGLVRADPPVPLPAPDPAPDRAATIAAEPAPVGSAATRGEPPQPPRSRWETMSSTELPPRPAVVEPEPDPAKPAAGAPSRAFFDAKVLPVLDRACLSCHGDPRLPVGKLVLVRPGDSGHTATTRKKNFDACVRFLDAADPERSPLLLKGLALDDGGTQHGGGDNLRKGDDAWTVLLLFARGEAPAAARPVAATSGDRWVEVGKAARCDGSKSRDPAGGPLQFRWKLAAAPRDSRAELQPVSAAEIGLRPDRPGCYLLELEVEDTARLRSDPVRARVHAYVARLGKGTTAVAADALDEAVRRFWGRAAAGEERTALRRLDPAGAAAEIVRHDAFWSDLLERDLEHLDLVGPFRPAGIDDGRLAVRLAGGESGPVELFRRLLTDEAFARRYPQEPDAAAAASLRLLGEPPPVDPGEPPARRAESVLARPEFRALWLERHHRRWFATAPAANEVDAWDGSAEGLATLLRSWVARTLR